MGIRAGSALFGAVAVLLAVAVLATACGDDGEEAAPASPSPQGGGEFTVLVDDFSFDPAQLSGQEGKEITVNLANQGDTIHTFTIDELGVDQTLQSGEAATVTFTPPQDGTFAFYCRFHRSQGMEGALTVASASTSGGVPSYGY